MKQFLAAFLCLFSVVGTAQTYHLSDGFNEISGLDFLNDSTLIALNDGGNEPLLFVLDLKGKIQSMVKVNNATNVDWEDITVDDEYVYVGDIGNNLNERKSLTIYKVKITDILTLKVVEPELITFNYAEQLAFPPDKKEQVYDAEALAVKDDTLYLFTKNRSRPTDGMSWVYKIPTAAGNYSVPKFAEIYIGKGGLMVDALTAADIVGDEFFLMTYNRVIIKTCVNGVFVGEEVISFKTYSQKEALAVKSKMEIFVADEKQIMLGGPRMYRIAVRDLRED